MRRVRWAVVILSLIAGCETRGDELGKPRIWQTMPFELVSDFLVVVEGQIGNVNGLRFILDTGSSYTAIDQTVAERLKLQRRAGKVINFDRTMPAEWTDIQDLRIGPIREERASVMVVRLAEYSEFGRNVDGIIGLDVLRRARKLTIDFAKRTISLQRAIDSSDAPAMAKGFVVPIVVQGFPIHLLIDTGFQGILLYKDRLRKEVPELRTEGESFKMTIGRLQGTQVRLPGVRIYGVEEITPVFLMDGPGKDVPGIDGYLGLASLHAKCVQFDFDAGVLRWQ